MTRRFARRDYEYITYIVYFGYKRVGRTFARGGFVFRTRIQHRSLTVAPTIDRNYSRITITTVATQEAIEQICKQLHRLIPVLKVSDLSVNEAIEREIVMIKLQVKDEDADKILRIAEVTGAKVIDITDKAYTLQIVDDEKQIQALIELIKPYGYKEFVRSGKVAISRS